MFALHNKGTSNASQARELQKLKRQDLLELLLEQMRENDNLSLELERRRVALEGLDATLERLKAKLNLKDVQIEHLKEKLDLKDKQIEHLKQRLDEKDARIARLKDRLDVKDQIIAGMISQTSNFDIDGTTMEDLLKTEEFTLEALMAGQRMSGENAQVVSGEAQPADAAVVQSELSEYVSAVTQNAPVDQDAPDEADADRPTTQVEEPQDQAQTMTPEDEVEPAEDIADQAEPTEDHAAPSEDQAAFADTSVEPIEDQEASVEESDEVFEDEVEPAEAQDEDVDDQVSEAVENPTVPMRIPASQLKGQAEPAEVQAEAAKPAESPEAQLKPAQSQTERTGIQARLAAVASKAGRSTSAVRKNLFRRGGQ